MDHALHTLHIPDTKIQEAEGSLRFGESLISGLTEPAYRLNIILRYAAAFSEVIFVNPKARL